MSHAGGTGLPRYGGALLALVNRKDGHHAYARRVMAQLAREHVPLATSDWVLAEFLNAACRIPLRAVALRAVGKLRRSPVTSVMPADHSDWLRALDFFAARPDKEWSFIDCASMVLCTDQGIRRVFTSDRHFAQAGFEILLK